MRVDGDAAQKTDQQPGCRGGHRHPDLVAARRTLLGDLGFLRSDLLVGHRRGDLRRARRLAGIGLTALIIRHGDSSGEKLTRADAKRPI